MQIPQPHENLLKSRKVGVLATLKRDGRPQMSNVAYHYDAGVIRVSVTDDRAKVKNLRRDPRASLHVASSDGWQWVVAEGIAELSPVAVNTDDETVDELIALYRDVAGEHPDWAEFRTAMVAEKRLLLRLKVDRTYGTS
jgi:PPOX class probable F420-dependent enzyme